MASAGGDNGVRTARPELSNPVDQLQAEPEIAVAKELAQRCGSRRSLPYFVAPEATLHN